MTIIYKSRIFW